MASELVNIESNLIPPLLTCLSSSRIFETHIGTRHSGASITAHTTSSHLRIKMKGIADLLDSDMEESAPIIDENSILSSASDATGAKPVPAKRATKRQRVTMPPKAKSKPQANKAATKKTAGVKRKADDDLDDQETQPLDTAEVEDEPPAPKTKKRARPTPKSKLAAKEVETQETEDDLVQVEEPLVELQATKTTKSVPKKTTKGNTEAKPKASQRARKVASEPPEDAQQEVQPESPPKQRVYASDTSRTRQDPPFRRRAGSASDTERGDPNLRRKLGDVTRKFENVDLKYRNLKEVGINEANANMEKLRKQCDATMQASSELIASLKKELATQAPLAQETRKLKKQMQTQEDEMNKIRKSATELSGTLTAAQNEVKALQAKLAAARSAPADHAKTPGMTKGAGQRALIASNTEAAKIMEMKLGLYSDLTGLDVLNVKQTEEGHTFDCLQSGQNGSKFVK